MQRGAPHSSPQRPAQAISWCICIHAFNWSVWLAVLFICFFVGFLLWMIEHKSVSCDEEEAHDNPGACLPEHRSLKGKLKKWIRKWSQAQLRKRDFKALRRSTWASLNRPVGQGVSKLKACRWLARSRPTACNNSLCSRVLLPPPRPRLHTPLTTRSALLAPPGSIHALTGALRMLHCIIYRRCTSPLFLEI